jgi:hypothetical protein
MGNHPAMQVRDDAARVRGEHERQHCVYHARQPRFHQQNAEGRRDAEVFEVGFTHRRRMLAEAFQ